MRENGGSGKRADGRQTAQSTTLCRGNRLAGSLRNGAAVFGRGTLTSLDTLQLELLLADDLEESVLNVVVS